MRGIPSPWMRCCFGSLALSAALQADAGELLVAISSDEASILSEAVVFAVPRSPDAVAAAKLPVKSAIVDQKGKEFVPLASAVRVGTPVDFPNSDNIRHQVYSFSPAKVFNLKLYSGRPSTPVTFDRPGVVALGCNIHDRMIAWLLVVDTPWIAYPDARGVSTFKDLPEGEYDLRVWHPGINPNTNAESVGENVRMSAVGRLSKTLRVSAPPGAKLRLQLQSVEDGSISLAPPRAGAN